MPTTPNYAFPYPALTNAPNVPADIQALAVAVDTEQLNNSRIIARALRTANSSSATGVELPVLRIDNIPMVSGLQYSIRTGLVTLASSVATDTAQCELHIDTTGAAATVASALIPGSQALVCGAPSGIFPPCSIDVNYVATSTGNVSILLGVGRFSGSGGCYIYADAVNRPLALKVFCDGVSVAVTGTGNTL
jgi:hypothetical protein